MNEILDNIIVVGHQRPDTDASASACGYATFLNRVGRYDTPVVGAIPGPLTPQAKYVFERSQIEEPVLIEDVSPMVGHAVNRKPMTLSVNERVGDAVQQLVRCDLSVLPVLNDDGSLHGLFSNRNDTSQFLLGFDPTPLWGTLLTVDDLISMPGIRIIGDKCIAEGAEGELRIALDGDRQWTDDLRPGDVVISGSLQCFENIPSERWPASVVIVGRVPELDETLVQQFLSRNINILYYESCIASLLRGLALHIRLGSLSLPVTPSIGTLDRLEDIQHLVQYHPHALPVLDGDGQFEGILSRSDSARAQRARVILVDHFELPQSVGGVESAEVLEIVDHHRVGDIQTHGPIRVTCRPVGSSCTIVATEFLDQKVDLDAQTATLLLGGIVADTLVLRGPTTTEVDRQVAKELARIAGVDLETFGTEVLVAGDDLIHSNAAEIWDRDQKQFSIRNQNFAVAQLETASLDRIPDEKLDEFRELVLRDKAQNDRLLSLLVLTDVLQGCSWMFGSEDDEVQGVIRKAFSADEPRAHWIAAPGVVSRKKQILPRVMQALAS